MSLLRTFRPLRSPTNLFLRPSRISSFHTSTTLRALSEGDIRTCSSHTDASSPTLNQRLTELTDEDKEDRDRKVDHHKNDQINKVKETGQGEWKPELASQSEQGIQAEKHDMSMEEMQKMGSQKAQEGKQPAGSSSNTGGSTG